MQCRILGPLEVAVNGAPVDVHGERRRGLLAFLLVNAGKVVTVEEIVDAVWPTGTVGNYGTVRTYVSQLRKAFVDEDAQITTIAGAYRLTIERAALDATRFEDLSDAGNIATEPKRRRDLFEAALGCWRGRALAEFADFEWAQRAARALEVRRLEVLEARIDADLALGRSHDLLPELETLVHDHPLSERFWAQRMLALYRCGHQADALRACAELRTLLADELGIEPSREVVALELRILDQDPTLLAPTSVVSTGVSISSEAHLPRGTVTFLMTDIVSSTELWDDDAALMAHAVRAHEAIIDDAVTTAGGHRLKRAGEGDSTLSVFERAADALDAALGVRAAIERGTGGVSVAVRVALHTGEAEERDGDYFGPTLNRAARLRALANGNEIVCSGTTADLVADALPRSITLVELGPTQLRGLRRSEIVYRVVAETASSNGDTRESASTERSSASDSERLPARLIASMTSAPAIVGRDNESRVLARSWQRVVDNRTRQLVLLCGEPGIGKTRLAAEAAEFARRQGACVLYGRCDEGMAVPYQPFVEALRGYIDRFDGVDLPDRLGRYAGELARLAPELATRIPSTSTTPLRSDPASEQYRLFDAVAGWLEAAAARRPIVLVLDDLHWAADPTLLLLRHVVCSEPSAPVLVIATYRASELGRSARLVQLVAELHADLRSAMERLDLTGLDEDDIETLIAASPISEDECAAPLARRIHTLTAGNPFFIGEILRSLAETQSEGPLGELHIPRAAREVVRGRISRLPEDSQHALTVAAVIGTEFDVPVLEEVSELSDDALLTALEDASAAQLVAECGFERFTFTHALVRTELYEDLTRSRRRRLHRRTGEAIERVHARALDAHLSALALHFADSDPEKAVRYAIRAADAALQKLAFEDAVNICERALVTLTQGRAAGFDVSTADECDLVLRLGRAEVSAARAGGRRTLMRSYELAREVGDPQRMAEALLAGSRGFFSRTGRVDGDLIAALEEAIECQPADTTAVSAELLAVLASELQWDDDGERRFELADRALATARRVGEPRTLARVLLLRPLTILAPDTLEERVANCEELMRLANDINDPAILFQAAWSRTSTVAEAGDFHAADEMVDLTQTIAEELRQPLMRWQASSMRASQQILRGRLDDAEQLAADTLALGHLAHQDAEASLFYTEQLLEIRRWQDRLPEMMTGLREFVGSPETDFGFVLLRHLCDSGDVDRAYDCYEKVAKAFVFPPRRDLLAGATLCNLAYLAARFGDAERASRVYEALEPFGAAFAQTTICKAVGAHFLGMLAATLGEPATADRYFEQALVAHEHIGAPLLAAETRVEWSASLHSRDPARSHELVDAAHTTARAHGAPFIERRCAESIPV